MLFAQLRHAAHLIGGKWVHILAPAVHVDGTAAVVGRGMRHAVDESQSIDFDLFLALAADPIVDGLDVGV